MQRQVITQYKQSHRRVTGWKTKKLRHLMTICLKTSSAGSASEGFSDMHAETARMSGITNRVLRPVPDAEARKPIRGRHNLRYAIEKPWVETRGFSIAGGWDWSDVEVSSPEQTGKSMNQ